MHRDPEPRFLRTVHGTVVYQDRATGEVRHGPWGAATRNLPVPPDLIDSVDLPVGGGGFAVRRGERQEIALERDGIFLCAEKNGRVTHSRVEASKWETFVPVTGDTLDVLAALTLGDWLIEPTHEVIHGAEHRWRSGWEANLAGHPVDLRADPDAFAVFGRSPDGLVERFSFRSGPYGTFLARQYDPLVYYCVFGADSYFGVSVFRSTRFARSVSIAARSRS